MKVLISLALMVPMLYTASSEDNCVVREKVIKEYVTGCAKAVCEKKTKGPYVTHVPAGDECCYDGEPPLPFEEKCYTNKTEECFYYDYDDCAIEECVDCEKDDISIGPCKKFFPFLQLSKPTCPATRLEKDEKKIFEILAKSGQLSKVSLDGICFKFFPGVEVDSFTYTRATKLNDCCLTFDCTKKEVTHDCCSIYKVEIVQVSIVPFQFDKCRDIEDWGPEHCGCECEFFRQQRFTLPPGISGLVSVSTSNVCGEGPCNSFAECEQQCCEINENPACPRECFGVYDLSWPTPAWLKIKTLGPDVNWCPDPDTYPSKTASFSKCKCRDKKVVFQKLTKTGVTKAFVARAIVDEKGTERVVSGEEDMDEYATYKA